MLGLGGLHPEKYLEVVPEHKNCVLVDFNPADALVRRNSLIREFDLLTNSPAERSPLNFVDCDFCKSIINNGADLLYIYTKMQLSPIRNKYITFTFSCRTAGGRVITLVGTHAFEYAIHIEGVRTVTETFENGTLARKRFNELKKKP